MKNRRPLLPLRHTRASALEPHICYLSEQHRQEDPAFLELLSAIRAGTVSEKHHGLLHSRRGAVSPAETTKLFSHNVDVDRVNAVALEKLPARSMNSR